MLICYTRVYNSIIVYIWVQQCTAFHVYGRLYAAPGLPRWVKDVYIYAEQTQPCGLIIKEKTSHAKGHKV